MRRGTAAAVMALAILAGGCSPTTTASTQPTTATPTPQPLPAHFERYVGAYPVAGGPFYVVNASGHLLNLRDSFFRQMYPTTIPDRFTVGPGFTVSSPKQADVTFHMAGNRADQLTFKPVTGAAVVASRTQLKETDVHIPSGDAVLAGTITEPVTPGPHPGIVIIHGSEPGQRFYYGVWVGLYASLGMTVLTYDKRGNGESTGHYPGEFATDSSLGIYAGDATSALRFLSRWPGVDPKRVGFHGGSQGGWTVPLAMQRYHAPAAFAVIASGPAVSVDQQGAWAGFSASSTLLPGFSEAEMNAQVRAVQSTGYDPAPVLKTIQQPMLWFNGAIDRQVPTTINTEILQSFHHSNWDIVVLPGVDHGLFENPSGLEPDEPKAKTLAAGLWDLIASWLASTAGTLPLTA